MASKKRTMMDWALLYASNGFSVIPIREGHKFPPLVKFADKPPLTAKQIREIWSKHPNANIALKTTDFFVVDVDTHNGVSGLDSLDKLGHPEWFEHTLQERTPTGGIHYYFAKSSDPRQQITEDIGWRQNVDIKAHKNNYVVCSPSKTIDGQYRWINQENMMPPAPGLLRDIQRKEAPERPILSLRDVPKTAGYNYTPGKKTRTAELFETIANGLGDKGQRDDNLTRLAGGLLFRGVSPDATMKLGVMANARTPEPLPDREVGNTVNSMIRKDARRLQALAMIERKENQDGKRQDNNKQISL